jgi:hypothetical protein
MQKRGIALLACAALLWGTATPRIGQAAERHAATHFLLGAGSFLSTVVYGTVKTGYAVLGSVIGGLAFALTGGRGDVARAIIQPSVRGDYVVTPEHLTMERPLIFSGRDPIETTDY